MCPDDPILDPAFDLLATFRSAEGLLGLRPGQTETLAETALIALDTNALLVPYGTGRESLREIISVFGTLAAAKRLVVPAHVIREFVRQRALRLGEVYAALEGRYGKFGDVSSMAPYPFLEDESSFKEVLAIESELRKLAEKHSAACRKVRDRVAAWGWGDPVSTAYTALFKDFVFQEPATPEKDLVAQFGQRTKLRVPPGFKDAGKDSNAAGDFLIWKTLLSAAKSSDRDLLFVTGEKKSDWWVRSGGGVLWPRPELIAEFARETGGHLFGMLDLGELLRVLKAPDPVVRDVERAEVDRSLRSDTESDVKAAEAAVRGWLKAVYDLRESPTLRQSPLCDFVLGTLEGKGVAAEVKWMRSRAHLGVISEAVTRVEQARREIEGVAAVLCLVHNNLEQARRTRRSLRLLQARPPAVTVHVGVLRGGRFVEVVTEA